MPRTPGWTDDDLRRAVSESATLGAVARRLGLRAGGGTYQSLRRHISRLGLDDSHLPVVVDGRVRRLGNWTDDDLRRAVQQSSSHAQVQRRLGFVPSGGMHRYLALHIRRLRLDTGHFTGQAWARGRKLDRGKQARPLAEILVVDSTYLNSGRLRARVVAAGLLEPRCAHCGLDSWRGQPLPLALDHINGDPADNRIENLRILCPNCHALTDTWCGRNRGRRTPMQRDRV